MCIGLQEIVCFIFSLCITLFFGWLMLIPYCFSRDDKPWPIRVLMAFGNMVLFFVFGLIIYWMRFGRQLRQCCCSIMNSNNYLEPMERKRTKQEVYDEGISQGLNDKELIEKLVKETDIDYARAQKYLEEKGHDEEQ